MRCAVFCPDMAIKTKKTVVDGKEKIEVCDADMDYCKGCGICEVECPVKAIKMEDVC